MIAFLTYLGGISSALRGFFAVIGIIGIVAVVFFIVMPNRMTESGWKTVRNLLLIFISLLLLHVLTPDQETCLNVISELRQTQSCAVN